MLQRAASNAYSWWWASHIRTKQSKWLEQNLQDMEDKVQSTLKLISEDGDSFAKRAEMYYKRRPELINFVEESYRAYRSLAERYDHISTELQNANNALATYFPDQVQFAMDDGDDDEDSPRKRNVPPPSSSSHLPKPSAPIPKVPKAPLKDLKSILSSGAKKLRPKKDAKASPAAATFSKSGLTKPEGLERIDKLQKDILELQTVKEFVKSSYEGGVAKYWEIEDQITGMQADVSALQDEFNETVVIEDDEARSLMTATALKSCQETLAELQEKQGKSVEAAKVEQMRIKEVRDKFYTLKKEIFLPPNESSSTEKEKSSELRDTDEEEEVVAVLEEKIKEHFQVESSSSSSSSLTVTEMTEKIDELVNKVISLETAVSSQDALIARLKSETNHLQWQIQVLEKDRAKGGGSEQNMRNKMEEMEHSLHEVEDLTLDVKKKNVNLHTHFAEAKCNLQLLYEVHCVKSDDEQEEETASLPKSSRTEDLDKDTPQGEPIKAASSSRKPRAESGLIIGAKKLMGFKVQEDTTGKQKRANQDKEKQEEEEPLPNVVSSDSSSSVKVNQPPPRAESGLLTEAKKLMGFKLLEDSATDPPYTNEQQKVSNSTVEKKLEQQTEAATLSSSSDEEVGEKKIETGTTQTQSTSTSSEEQNNAQNTPPKEAADVSVQDITSDKSSAAKEIEIEPQQQQNDEANKEETEMVNSCVQTEPPEKQEANQDEPNWRELFLQGMEVREKTLLNEYTATLRNYKDLKKKLNEVEKKKSEDGQAETIIEQLRALKTANAMKDEEIRALHEKLDHLQTVLGQNKEEKKLIIVRESFRVQSRTDAEFEDEIKVMMAADIDEEPVSEVEEKLRMDIDQVLEVNLDFWLRFSESLNQIKKYETAVEDLRREISKLEEKASKQQEGSSKNKEGSSHRSKTLNLKSDMKPIYKHLREIQTELAVWNDKCLLLKEEQQSRFTSLCDIQEEITKAVKASAEDEDFTFTSYQAAKFQGEVLNMKQENNKVANELQAGLDHITVLQIDVDRTLVRLNQEYEFSGGGSNSHQAGNLTQSPSRARVPLRSFIFGVKQKKRPSIFTCMTPAMHRKYNGLRVGF